MKRDVVIKYLLDGELDKLLSIPNKKMSELMDIVIQSYSMIENLLDKQQIEELESFKTAIDSYHAEEILHAVSESFLAGMEFAFALKSE